MTRDPEADALEFARKVAEEADAQGIPTALIGAVAMAAHRYVRATDDVDLGACTFFPKLRDFHDHLRSIGYEVELRWPEDGDPLDGVIDIEHDGASIQVVNIADAKLGRAAIDNAGTRPIRDVLPDLIPRWTFPSHDEEATFPR